MQTVRVIVDTRDAKRDYRLPKDRAEQLFNAGEIGMAGIYNGRWDYEDPQLRHTAERVNKRGKAF